MTIGISHSHYILAWRTASWFFLGHVHNRVIPCRRPVVGNMAAKSILKGELLDAESSTVSARFSKKRVNFGDITVYEFPNLLGDNPAVTDGAPLTIAWKHVNVNVFTIEYNEFVKQKRPRRRKKDMILSSSQRDTVRYFRFLPSIYENFCKTNSFWWFTSL